MDHLAEQVDVAIRVLFQGSVRDIDGIFHPVAKSEVSGNEKGNRTEIQGCWREILLHGIGNFEPVFDLLDDG